MNKKSIQEEIVMKKIFAGFVSFMLVLNLVACSGGNATTTTQTEKNNNNDTFKIGGIGPITGGAAVYGLAVKNAMEIAINEINANGGINGYKVEGKFEDDEHDTEKSVNAYNSLKDWGMQLLNGTVTSGPCIAVADKSNEDNIFQLTPSGSAVECVLHDNVFRVCFSDPNQGAASADYIDKHNLATKVGVIYDASDVYSTGIYEKFVQNSKGKNFEIACEEQFTADSKTDFTTQLNKIKQAGCDLVFLPFYYTEASLVLNQANSMDYKPTFFGCDGLDGLLTLSNFDTKLAEDVMLLTPFSADATDALTTNFVNKYKQDYKDIPNQFAADSYDAVYIMKACIEKANLTPQNSTKEICDAMKKTMTEIKIDGLTGNGMYWTKDGEPNKDPKAVVIKNGKYQLVQ